VTMCTLTSSRTPDMPIGSRTSRPTSMILTCCARNHLVGWQEDVREPIGMSGVRLEVKVHIVTVPCPQRSRTSSSACGAAASR